MAKDVIEAGRSKLRAQRWIEGTRRDAEPLGSGAPAAAASESNRGSNRDSGEPRAAACCTLSFGDHTGLGVWGGIVLADRRVCRCCCGAPPTAAIDSDAPIVRDHDGASDGPCPRVCACKQWPVGGVDGSQAQPRSRLVQGHERGNSNGEEEGRAILPAWITVWHMYRQPRVWEARILDVARDMGCVGTCLSRPPPALASPCTVSLRSAPSLAFGGHISFCSGVPH